MTTHTPAAPGPPKPDRPRHASGSSAHKTHTDAESQTCLPGAHLLRPYRHHPDHPDHPSHPDQPQIPIKTDPHHLAPPLSSSSSQPIQLDNAHFYQKQQQYHHHQHQQQYQHHQHHQNHFVATDDHSVHADAPVNLSPPDLSSQHLHMIQPSVQHSFDSNNHHHVPMQFQNQQIHPNPVIQHATLISGAALGMAPDHGATSASSTNTMDGAAHLHHHHHYQSTATPRQRITGNIHVHNQNHFDDMQQYQHQISAHGSVDHHRRNVHQQLPDQQMFQQHRISPINDAMRTLYFGNLPPKITLENLLNHIKGGPIEQVRLLADRTCAFITFLNAPVAAAIFQESQSRRFSIRGNEIRVGWGKPSLPPPSVLLAIQQGASRNVFLGNLDEQSMTTSYLTAVFSEFGSIDHIKVLVDKHIAFVHLASIHAAMRAVNQLAIHPDWANRRIYYGKDRCAYVGRSSGPHGAGGPAHGVGFVDASAVTTTTDDTCNGIGTAVNGAGSTGRLRDLNSTNASLSTTANAVSTNMYGTSAVSATNMGSYLSHALGATSLMLHGGADHSHPHGVVSTKRNYGKRGTQPHHFVGNHNVEYNDDLDGHDNHDFGRLVDSSGIGPGASAFVGLGAGSAAGGSAGLSNSAAVAVASLDGLGQFELGSLPIGFSSLDPSYMLVRGNMRFSAAAPNRTVYIGGIHPDVTIKDLCDAIRGGILQNIKYMPERNIAFATFIDQESATDFYSRGVQEGLSLRSKRVKFGWGKPSPVPPLIANLVQNGASRNVYVGAIDDTITEDRLLRDFSQFGDIELINIVSDKNIAFVNFTDIMAAIKAVEVMRVHEGYAKHKINFGKDRCGNPPRVRSGTGSSLGSAILAASVGATVGIGNSCGGAESVSPLIVMDTLPATPDISSMAVSSSPSSSPSSLVSSSSSTTTVVGSGNVTCVSIGAGASICSKSSSKASHGHGSMSNNGDTTGTTTVTSAATSAINSPSWTQVSTPVSGLSPPLSPTSSSSFHHQRTSSMPLSLSTEMNAIDAVTVSTDAGVGASDLATISEPITTSEHVGETTHIDSAICPQTVMTAVLSCSTQPVGAISGGSPPSLQRSPSVSPHHQMNAKQPHTKPHHASASKHTSVY